MNTRTELKVPDMVCGGCAGSIKKALGGVPGVDRIDVDINAKTVRVEHDGKVSREKIVETLDRAGYSAA